MGLIANRTEITWTPIRNNDISWNFQKCLIHSNGHPYKRYTSRTTPEAIEEDIKLLLQECENGNATNNISTPIDPVPPSLPPSENCPPLAPQPGPAPVPVPAQSGSASAQVVGSNTLVISSTNPIQPVAKKQKRSVDKHSHPVHDGLFF